MAKTSPPFRKILFSTLLTSLIPFLVAVWFGIIEHRMVNQLDAEGISTTATLTEAWKTSGRWSNYFIRYELKLTQPSGTKTGISHTEEISRSHYQAIQGQQVIEIRYIPSEPSIIRSETYSIKAISNIYMFLTIAGVLFLPGFASLFVSITLLVPKSNKFSKYIVLIPLVSYLGIMIRLATISLENEYGPILSPINYLFPSVTAILLLIGDIFHIPWLSDFR